MVSFLTTMVAVVKRILTDVEMHLLKETATVWAVWFACVWWRKSILHVIFWRDGSETGGKRCEIQYKRQ